MSKKQTFYRICMLKQFLTDIQTAKQNLLDELINRATDEVILKRRFRMLGQLAHYESQVIDKIYNIETEDNFDFFNDKYSSAINNVIDKSA